MADENSRRYANTSRNIGFAMAATAIFTADRFIAPIGHRATKHIGTKTRKHRIGRPTTTQSIAKTLCGTGDEESLCCACPLGGTTECRNQCVVGTAHSFVGWPETPVLVLTPNEIVGHGAALNEADVLGVEVDPSNRVACVTFRVLALSEVGTEPSDTRVQFRFHSVGRVVASLREGHWDDAIVPIVPIALEALLPTAQSFGGLPIYGWEFVDCHERDLSRLSDRLSLDWHPGNDGRSHSISLFQDGGNRILDLYLWFGALETRDPYHRPVPIASFIAAGKRWWDAFCVGDERTKGYGMAPLRSPAVLNQQVRLAMLAADPRR
ncbi:MAG: hypothetical protein BWZ07_00045 [Alphaproteobacteria bacterium ADurb.BinA280]|nr:MAG: hypothetical protein BWZ07_00045 [Alphaproteobacteria bacterium ADurb.BinA280]